MRLPINWQHLTFAAVISAVVLVADSPALAQTEQQARTNPSMSSTAGLILQESEGERRVRRPHLPASADRSP